ncbi:MAG: hypothetical protein ABIT83_12295 [Massilia sp.]
MRLPGSRYQEHGWEHVRKLLGHCSLQALAHGAPARLLEPSAREAQLGGYVDSVADLLRHCGQPQRAAASGNSYGDSVLELAASLVCELQARPADWLAFCAAVAAEFDKTGAFWEREGGEAILRKKVNDMYAVLRDKVDADNYQAACGRLCSPNKMYAYRMLDTAYGDIARIFAAWREHLPQVEAILGRTIGAEPIETRQLSSILGCRAEWVLRWSESRERFGAGPGPLHTRSKRFASLKDNADKIGAMLREIGEYEQLSANHDNDWRADAGEAALWLDDLARVLADSEQAASGESDQILAPDEERFDDPEQPSAPDAPEPAWSTRAMAVSLPPGYMLSARAAQQNGSWSVLMMAEDSLPVRLAVYLKILGAFDDSYPAEWLDPATGELPTMLQRAGLDRLSLPTLRKRRDAAIARLHGAARP